MARITTSLGDIDESRLTKVEQRIDTATERTTVVEYHLEGVPVHRSVHVTLKQASATAALLVNSFK
jgi:hypothetical protein